MDRVSILSCVSWSVVDNVYSNAAIIWLHFISNYTILLETATTASDLVSHSN